MNALELVTGGDLKGKIALQLFLISNLFELLIRSMGYVSGINYKPVRNSCSYQLPVRTGVLFFGQSCGD